MAVLWTESIYRMEIEAKYRVADRQVFTELLKLTTLGHFNLIPHPDLEHQHNTYYDTSDSLIAAQRMSFRIRRTGTTYRATLKRSHGGRGALHMRDELETTVGDDPQPIFWRPSPVRKQLLEIIGTSPLEELFTLQNRRRRVDVMLGSALIAELSLDEGSIEAGRRILGFRELEVELHHPGTLAHLEQLGAELAERFSLPPEPHGKRSRGMGLLRKLTESRVAMGTCASVG
jgi:inorganic triphosphatase YgiF